MTKETVLWCPVILMMVSHGTPARLKYMIPVALGRIRYKIIKANIKQSYMKVTRFVFNVKFI